MDSSAYDGQWSSDVDIKDPWKDIADATLRIHKDLIPYDELTKEEKEKDKDNIRMLQKLFAES